MKVGDEYRKNRLSFSPGGVTVVVEYAQGGGIHTREYDKVKNPDAFIRAVKKNNKNIHKCWIKEE